jgi:hypothetical protein
MASLSDFQQVIDFSDTARGSGNAISSGSCLSVFDSAAQRDHAVLNADIRANDSLRDIPGFDFG